MPVPPKNILVFCDGTGQDGLITEEAPKDKAANHFTNVLRLSRAISQTYVQEDGEERPQIVFYQSGVGVATDFNADEALSDNAKKAFGTAVASKIRDAYNFIAQNYREGDQISLFGFSRGAYTARKISGLIERLGLLSPGNMGKFFQYWKQLNGKLPGDPPRPDKPVPIKCLVTWDTVGSVRNGTQEMVDALQLHDDALASNVENAWHAVWFSGAHSDVGGGYAEMELADITLAWIVGEITPFVGVDTEFVEKSLSNNTNKPKWGQSTPHNAYVASGILRPLMGRENRLPLITKDSVLHPSLLLAPDTKGMVTVSDLKKHLKVADLQACTWPMNEFEERVKEFWHDIFRDTEVPQFETQEDAEDLV
ncbi:putative protein YEL023C OS=Saccharomyces cerevisiae (strain ATCC 204508 / S288c) GN=YEL023C PE=4 SV=1 [Rhizoctonia solani AG-1 IB]|uniref:T6SS Phospholipase effector Tle1-like catalytic domain-containing protein n=1 Tax=Thanatephorus cucumeris (strain AG1-IB / isolate 7/3/14) TaxID=1108050 RepID=A0A0B7G2T6_THACB|nr:putative protein YEL023C OS=Saccharomyces cerevisiae (strain ATCC 204508 / S288c) GN=YEL023C PE=4 SV=1 [Rhizoctonia solani AG-1 IB]